MDHTFDKHLAAINSMCRLCARQLVTQKQKKNRQAPLALDKVLSDLTLIGFVFRSDIPDVHSRFVCDLCKNALRNSKVRNSVTAIDKLRTVFQETAHIWCEFDSTIDLSACTVCSHRAVLSKVLTLHLYSNCF